MNKLLILTVVSLPISITLHHGLIILCVLVGLYLAVKNKTLPKGSLLNSIHLFNLATIVSAVLYMPEKLRVALSSSFLRYGYVAPLLGKFNSERVFSLTITILILEGLALIPVFIYNLEVNNMIKLLWGNMYKVAEIYSLFILCAVALALYKRSWKLGLVAILFFVVMLVPARRSETLGLLITLVIITFLYLKAHKRFIKHAIVLLFAFLLTSVGGFLYLAEYKKDYRFVVAMKLLKGEEKLTEDTLNRLSTTRWYNLKAAIVVIKKDIENKNWIPLLVGHGIYSGHKLDPRPPNGLTFYESVVFVQEFIQRGLLGVIAMLFIFVKSFLFLIRMDLSEKSNILALPFASYLVFYNFSTLFTPYINSTYPIALLMFAMAEAHIKQSQAQRI